MIIFSQEMHLKVSSANILSRSPIATQNSKERIHQFDKKKKKKKIIEYDAVQDNYTNPGYGLSLVDTLWNVGSYRQPLEQEGNPMT